MRRIVVMNKTWLWNKMNLLLSIYLSSLLVAIGSPGSGVVLAVIVGLLVTILLPPTVIVSVIPIHTENRQELSVKIFYPSCYVSVDLTNLLPLRLRPLSSPRCSPWSWGRDRRGPDPRGWGQRSRWPRWSRPGSRCTAPELQRRWKREGWVTARFTTV